jgi:hypothetical protein
MEAGHHMVYRGPQGIAEVTKTASAGRAATLSLADFGA